MWVDARQASKALKCKAFRRKGAPPMGPKATHWPICVNHTDAHRAGGEEKAQSSASSLKETRVCPPPKTKPRFKWRTGLFQMEDGIGGACFKWRTPCFRRRTDSAFLRSIPSQMEDILIPTISLPRLWVQPHDLAAGLVRVLANRVVGVGLVHREVPAGAPIAIHLAAVLSFFGSGHFQLSDLVGG